MFENCKFQALRVVRKRGTEFGRVSHKTGTNFWMETQSEEQSFEWSPSQETIRAHKLSWALSHRTRLQHRKRGIESLQSFLSTVINQGTKVYLDSWSHKIPTPSKVSKKIESLTMRASRRRGIDQKGRSWHLIWSVWAKKSTASCMGPRYTQRPVGSGRIAKQNKKCHTGVTIGPSFTPSYCAIPHLTTELAWRCSLWQQKRLSDMIGIWWKPTSRSQES